MREPQGRRDRKVLLDPYVSARVSLYPSCHGVHVAEQRGVTGAVPKDCVALGEMVEVAYRNDRLVGWCQLN